MTSFLNLKNCFDEFKNEHAISQLENCFVEFKNEHVISHLENCIDDELADGDNISHCSLIGILAVNLQHICGICLG